MTNTPPTPPGARARVRRHSPSSRPVTGTSSPPVTHRMTQAYQAPIPRRVGWTLGGRIRDTHQTPDRTTRRSGQGRVHDGRVHGNVTFDVVGAGRDQGGRIERIVEGQHRPRGMPACLGGVKLVVTT